MRSPASLDLTLYAIADAAALAGSAAALQPGAAGLPPGAAASWASADELVAKAIAGGVTAIQIRAKGLADRELLGLASDIARVARAGNIPILINDRVDVALALNADGVHLGVEDFPVQVARRLLGRKAIIGVTAHSLAELEEASRQGANYIGFGAIYASPTKDIGVVQGIEGLRRARGLTRLPIVAIGGISAERAAEVMEAGADGIAVISGLWSAPDPERRAREYREAIARGRARR